MAKNILFLDDDKNRHRRITSFLIGNSCDKVFNVAEAIEKLKTKDYDIAFLDHDLNDKQMVDSFSDEETGYTLAKWIAENKPKISLVVVHSLNPGGSDNIASLLKNNDYFVAQVPFTNLCTNEAINQILNWEPSQ